MTAPEHGIAARLESKTVVSDGLAIFRLALEADFHFKPGQYATLWLTHRGRTIPRPYSISSSPSETRVLEFYINLVEEGKLTPTLWDPEVLQDLDDGRSETSLRITGPKGRFVLDPEDHRDLVFVASGTGLGPFISMVRRLREECLADPVHFRARRVYIVHGVSLSSHLGYREELERLAAESMADPACKLAVVYLPTISRPHLDPSWKGLRGRAETLFEPCSPSSFSSMGLQCTVKCMLESLLRPETHAVYVCGHPGTADRLTEVLSRRGYRPDVDLRREKYYP